MYLPDLYADVTELVDGPDLGSGALICVWVRLPSSAPRGVAKWLRHQPLTLTYNGSSPFTPAN